MCLKVIPLDALRDPPNHLRVKDWYVDHLIEMLREPTGDPILVVASVKKSQFKQKELNKYTYQVSSLWFWMYAVITVVSNDV